MGASKHWQARVAPLNTSSLLDVHTECLAVVYYAIRLGRTRDAAAGLGHTVPRGSREALAPTLRWRCSTPWHQNSIECRSTVGHSVFQLLGSSSRVDALFWSFPLPRLLPNFARRHAQDGVDLRVCTLRPADCKGELQSGPKALQRCCLVTLGS